MFSKNEIARHPTKNRGRLPRQGDQKLLNVKFRERWIMAQKMDDVFLFPGYFSFNCVVGVDYALPISLHPDFQYFNCRFLDNLTEVTFIRCTETVFTEKAGDIKNICSDKFDRRPKRPWPNKLSGRATNRPWPIL